MNEHIRIGDTVRLTIRRLGINGEGIGYDQKMAIFVDYALPNEVVDVEITKVYYNRALASIKKIIRESKERTEPFCPVFGRCGGCQVQHLTYERMLVEKRDILLQALKRYVYPTIDPVTVGETIPSPLSKNYRNKASLPVMRIDGKNVFGMYAKGSNDFVRIESCPVQYERVNELLRTLTKLMDKHRVPALDSKKRGTVKSLVIRYSKRSGQAQVTFVVTRRDSRLAALVSELIAREKDVVSVFSIIKGDQRRHGFQSDDVELLYGEESIIESLDHFEFQLRPESFFQLNTEQASHFYRTMRKMAGLEAYEIAIDAYAGLAPVSHYIAGDAKQIYAIEIDPVACTYAKKSLLDNRISNVRMIQGDFKKALSGLRKMSVDVTFFDPPRTGLGKETIDLIKRVTPQRIVYGSCNPSTLAKDINLLQQQYDLVEVVPLDMFPYTSLVESVSLLVHRA
ncbi:MAG: 23S rRNA (uracil(1939)-C(5))-methyltransferase RlmD [Acholeplasmataceae bacterium]